MAKGKPQSARKFGEMLARKGKTPNAAASLIMRLPKRLRDDARRAFEAQAAERRV